MDMRTKFTQTKFKERPPPPVPKRTRKRKRCAPPVPDGESPVPDRKKSVPNEETPVPDGETLVPDVETTVPDDESTVPDGESPVPERKSPIPYRRKSVTDRRKSVPDGETPVSDRKKSVLDGETSVPDRKKSVPDGETSVPEEETPVPDGETASQTSAKFSPPSPPTPLKDFLIDIAQEVVVANPDDMIDHLAEYALGLQKQLRERQEEEDAIRLLMEEKAKRLEIETNACRVIQMAFRAFMAKKHKDDIHIEDIVSKGVTIEEANEAAALIQREYRRHNLMRKVRIKLMLDAAAAAELPDIEMGCPFKKLRNLSGGFSPSNVKLLKHLPEGSKEEVEKQGSVEELDKQGSEKELDGPDTPYNAEGETFGIDPPCHMAAPLLSQQSKLNELSVTDEVPDETDEPSGEMIEPEQTTEKVEDTSETIKTEEVVDAAAVPSGGQLEGQEDATTPTPPGEPNGNEEAEASPPSPAAEGDEGGEEKPEGSDVPETADEPPPPSPSPSLPLPPSSPPEPEPAEAPENPSGEEVKQDAAPPEENAVNEPEATETPKAENEAE